VRTTTESQQRHHDDEDQYFLKARRGVEIDQRQRIADHDGRAHRLEAEQHRVGDHLVAEGIAEEFGPLAEARLRDLVVVEEADADQHQERRQEDRCKGQRERQRELPLRQLPHFAISLLNFSIHPARNGLIFAQSCRT
jgi:hypothetical protein